ncbi:MAG TPA: electron transfer flavoprotein subunit alpha/FixB family protein [Deltaproteobacteria bacterium]|jgi:electron transfer flavoprotein alpha subunit|nr:electron transfer flavoprotein subunit alpha/FixB family protein [Deltaproteobacteria bacterium]
MADVLVCGWGELVRGIEETLTFGRKLAFALGGKLGALVLGEAPKGISDLAGHYGATTLDTLSDPRLAGNGADALVDALVQACRAGAPRAVVFPQTFDARLVAPRLAGRLGAPIVMNAINAEVEGGILRVTASAYGGDTHAVYEVAKEGPAILAVATTAVRAEPAPSPTAPTLRELAANLSGVSERIRIIEAASAKGPRLEDAGIIVAGGRGLGAREHFALIEQLAEAFGGMAGASRPLVDDGWVDASRQVGLTGHITRPALYVAVGISGASQHMAGCAAAKTIVAINKDADAAIFKHARYGIIGNCLEILPALIRAARERRQAEP